MSETITLGAIILVMFFLREPLRNVFCAFLGVDKGAKNKELTPENKNEIEKYNFRMRWAAFLSSVAWWVIVGTLSFMLIGSEAISAVAYFGVFGIFISFFYLFVTNNKFCVDTSKIADMHNRELGLVKDGIDGSLIRKAKSAKTNIAEVLTMLNKSSQDGVLVAFSVKNLGKEEAEREKASAATKKYPEFHKFGWRASVEDRAIVVGVPGSGKTTYLIAQLVDWMESGRSFVATDIKPEIWSILKENGLFEKFGYKDYVINPTCEHANKFNMFAEIENDADLNEILSVIISVGEGQNAVFNDNARRLLKAVLLHLGDKASLPAAREFITSCSNMEEMIDDLVASEIKTVSRIAREIRSTSGNERLLASIITAMNQAFEFLDDERISNSIESSDFSMKEVLGQDRTAVFLQFEQKYKSSLASLFGATVAYTLRVLQNNCNERKNSVFIALDEIINAAPIPKFSEFLNTIRSARMPLCMYLQSIEGLNKVYGPGSDELFIGSADLKVMFRVNDTSTARFVSIQSGETLQTTYNTSGTEESPLSFMTQDYGSTSTSVSHSNVALIDVHEMLQMPQGEAVVMYRGQVGQLKMPVYWSDYPMPNRASNNPRPAAIEAVAA